MRALRYIVATVFFTGSWQAIAEPCQADRERSESFARQLAKAKVDVLAATKVAIAAGAYFGPFGGIATGLGASGIGALAVKRYKVMAHDAVRAYKRCLERNAKDERARDEKIDRHRQAKWALEEAVQFVAIEREKDRVVTEEIYAADRRCREACEKAHRELCRNRAQAHIDELHLLDQIDSADEMRFILEEFLADIPDPDHSFLRRNVQVAMKSACESSKVYIDNPGHEALEKAARELANCTDDGQSKQSRRARNPKCHFPDGVHHFEPIRWFRSFLDFKDAMVEKTPGSQMVEASDLAREFITG